jgi:predicted amino acid dehydrogenase
VLSRERGVDFALIGHQESWSQIYRIVDHLRSPEKPPVSRETLRDIVPWIPPRSIFRLRLTSPRNGRTVEGAYVESFLTPDELAGGAGALRRSIEKVESAIDAAARTGARLAALGGFTSIVIEGREQGPGQTGDLALTTGNTLTAALIVKGVERAAALAGARLDCATLLVIGATGDIGSACTRYLSKRVRRVLLAGRRRDRIEQLAGELQRAGIDASGSTDVEALLPNADIVIGAASLTQPTFDLRGCRPGVIVCDAGYPKNLHAATSHARVFWGGLGQLLGGWESDSDLVESFYSFPAKFIAHGCMLEGMVLALADRFEPFSIGRGRITPAKIDEMWTLAEQQGVALAPFFDGRGCWETER